MTTASLLSFNVKFKSYELDKVTLPIEVRKPNMALVKRTLSSERIEIEPGVYFVTATLPAGQEIVSQIDVAAGEHKWVELTPAPEDESPHEYHEVQHFTKRELKPGRSFVLERGPTSVEARLRLFVGNFLEGQLTDVTLERLAPQPSLDSDLAQIRLSTSDQFQLLQLLQEDSMPLNIAVPGSAAGAAIMVLTRLPDGRCNLDMHLEHKEANLLCNYGAQNLYEQVAQTAKSSELDAEHLLQSKMANPVAAAVGAYALLRIGAVERLHDWTENLKNWFDWLPDGLTIRGEHLARMGKHDEALDLFLKLPSRGLPIFSDGLMYACDRLSYYFKLGEAEFGAEKVAQAKESVNLLRPFANYVDFGRPVLTYTGLDPLNPDNKPLETVPLNAGVNVNQFLARTGATEMGSSGLAV